MASGPAEEALWIREYANAGLPRFKALVKKRYADFVVDEIDLEGRVAAISEVMLEESLGIKDEATEEKVEEDVRAVFERELGELVSHIDLDEVIELFESEDASDPVFSKPLAEKAERTKFHAAVKTAFKGVLVSDTFEGSVRLVKRSATSGPARKLARLDHRNFQDPNRIPCLRFTLRKECMETIEALQLLARKIGVSPKDLSTAGTKDKRGVTTQFVTVRHVNPRRVAAADGMSGGKIRVSNLGAWEEPLRLGDLSGNRFTLVLREVECEDEMFVEAAVESLRSHGFVNYFGLQRFGSMSVKSHHIGLELLRFNWQGAIDLILAPRSDEPDAQARDARALWQASKDVAAAHALFPFRYHAERQVLWHFCRQAGQTDLMGAILAISRELRLMYVHSVQSYVWNRLVTERIKAFGRTPVIGDLVMGPGVPPAALTEANIASFTIFDVVMPVPGYQVQSPSGQVGELYKRIVADELGHHFGDDLTEAFRPKTKGLWDLPGAYRHVFVKPGRVECASGRYNEPEEAIPREIKQEGKYKAVRLTFALPSSSYATMALREVLDLHDHQ